MLPLSLSYDHRVVDGADGVRFTRCCRSLLADIRRLLYERYRSFSGKRAESAPRSPCSAADPAATPRPSAPPDLHRPAGGLIERYPALGGVCLNVGCIPSKALLHTAAIIEEAKTMGAMGVTFAPPRSTWTRCAPARTRWSRSSPAASPRMAKQRKVEVVQGIGRFEAPNRIGVDTRDGKVSVSFDHCIIACGSSPMRIPGFPHDDPRVMDSTGALEIDGIPERMLVVGGGIIGLEMASVYSALGAKIDVVELQNQLMPGADLDLVRAFEKVVKKRYDKIMLETKVASMDAASDGIKVEFDGKHAGEATYDKVLVAVGRRPNGKLINAEAAGVKVDEHGFIPVDQHMRTNVPNIFAIGDVVGNPMLAHKATHEGKVAAEVIAGEPALFDPLTIPSVAYTDPEVAWMGLTETEAKAKGIASRRASSPGPRAVARSASTATRA
jgi:dihydrolipoamide dehydrogenase